MVEGLKLELLSPNLVLIMQEILNCQNICKYLYYNDKNPLSKGDLKLPANNLLLPPKGSGIYPYPFSPTITDECSQIRIYYFQGNLNSPGVIEDIWINYDIICHTNVVLINDCTNSLIRYYEILKEIVNLFDQSLSTVGKINFKRFLPVYFNDTYPCIRLQAQMMTIGK